MYWNCLSTVLRDLASRYFANSLTSIAFSSSMVFPRYVNSFLFSSIFYFPLPVLLGLSNPTLLPGGAFLFAILLLILFPLPEPNGWSIAFIFTADVLGQSLFLVFFMKCIFPAFTIGFSSLPAPAIVPTTAPHSPWNLFSFF